MRQPASGAWTRRAFLHGAAASLAAPAAGTAANPGNQPMNNDTAPLVPRTSFTGRLLEFDFPGLRIGAAEYAEGSTGCTVFHFPKRAAVAIDARGGAVASLGTYDWVDAVCLAGGSVYGLEAATGVTAELLAQRNYSTAWDDIALVCGAIIYDYTPRKNAIYPDKALGRAALKSARSGAFPCGPRGAGSSATAGKWLLAPYQHEKAGQGGAFRQTGPTKVAVFTVVNALGAIVDRQCKVVRGHLDPRTGTRHHAAEFVDAKPPAPDRQPPGNTTLTVVVTNQKVAPPALRQLARQVHDSMARAIQPFHTTLDGDVLYAITTGEVDNARVSEHILAVLASEVAWDAVLQCY
jgi:L-aminopeptidase/D-esterase-like protein